MPETHLWMLVAPLIGALWWTERWLMHAAVSRWRLAVSGLVGTVWWVYLAYAATRVVVVSSGVTQVTGSVALAYACAFMAAVSVVGTLLGLLVWTEEHAEETARELPRPEAT